MPKMKSLNIDEQTKVRTEITQKINELSNTMNEEGMRESRNQFIEKFIICETLYKIVLKKYLQINNKYTHYGNMRIQLKQVKAALKKAGYTIDENFIDRLFSGTRQYVNQGNKSARLLRNGIEHEMNVADLQEIHTRNNSLIADMDKFIEWIQI